MRPRFLVDPLEPDASPEVVLPRHEAHHLSRVLRVGVGEEVGIFDGRGLEYTARVAAIEGQTVRVRLLARHPSPPAPRVRLTVVQALLKGDAMDDVIRDVTMVGVAVLQPAVSERTIVKAAAALKSTARWRRIALAAAKGCGRATLPEIRDPLPLDAWLAGPPELPAYLLVEPEAAEGALSLRHLMAGPAPGAATLIVGPEGGWSPRERAAALAASCRPVSLGPLTLRADAVPLAAAAALLAAWG